MGINLQQDKPFLMDFTLKELEGYLIEKGKKKFLAGQIFNWIYGKLIFNPENWSNVSKENQQFVKESFDLRQPEIVWHGLSKDGTRKFLLKMVDHKTVEAVAIPAQDRLTLCISSQVGCAIGCTFCHTGTQGLTRHLTTGEVVGQFSSVSRWLKDNVSEDSRLTNIVYMGMGEPLHNFENVKKASETFLEEKGFGLGQRRVTLSTSGLVPQIEKLEEFPPINIAISLHAAHDNIRTELMPINKAYDLKRLFTAIKKIPLKAHRRITYEYLLIDGLNDRQEDIDALVDLLDRKESKVNLIPFNEYPGSDFKRPSNNKIRWFQDQLCERGLTCTVRATKGQDILAACGQLKTFLETQKKNVW